QVANLIGEFPKLFAKLLRQISEHFSVDAHPGAFDPVKQRRQRQFDLAIDAAEIFLVDSLAQFLRHLRGPIGTFGREPRRLVPAFVWWSAAFRAHSFAREIAKFVLAPRGV